MHRSDTRGPPEAWIHKLMYRRDIASISNGPFDRPYSGLFNQIEQRRYSSGKCTFPFWTTPNSHSGKIFRTNGQHLRSVSLLGWEIQKLTRRIIYSVFVWTPKLQYVICFDFCPNVSYWWWAFELNFLVGYHYAKVAVKCFIAHLIRNYRVTTNYTDIDQLQLVQNTSLKLIEKHMIKLELRLE